MIEERDRSTTTITAWVTPGLDRNLRAAADIANDRGYNYLGDEHIVLAMLGNERSYLVRNWPAGRAMTLDELFETMRAALPPVQAPHIGPTEPVRVVTERTGPTASEITDGTAPLG